MGSASCFADAVATNLLQPFGAVRAARARLATRARLEHSPAPTNAGAPPMILRLRPLSNDYAAGLDRYGWLDTGRAIWRVHQLTQ